MSLPVDDMLRDADLAWQCRSLGHPGNLLGDLSCHIRALAEENGRLRDLNRRALAIIANAIMHGMPITDEVAAVRNAIVNLEPKEKP